MLLVTTSIEQTWGHDEKILFLGEWCKLYERKSIWQARKHQTLDDPWSNRERRFAAYKVSSDVYKKSIKILAEELNNFHEVSHPVRYWEILCETWLRLFIDSNYHHWECISDLIDVEKKLKTFQINDFYYDHIPTDIEDFQSKIVSDKWNHHMISSIINLRLKNIKNIKIDGLKLKDPKLEDFNSKTFIRKTVSFFYKCLMRCINYFGYLFQKSDSIFISNPYLSKINDFKLRLKLRSFSLNNIRPEYIKNPSMDKEFRDNLFFSEKGESEFENFIIRIMLRHIPYCYLEGLHSLKQAADLNQWPKNPKAIVTAIDFVGDDLFKFYCANSVTTGSKINTICHGGGGKYKYSDWQDMDFNISDKYFTWGWSEYSSKCVQGFFVKDITYRRSSNKNQKHLLHIMLSQYRYVKGIDATPSYQQYVNEYLNDQFEFLNALKQEIRKEVITKLSYDQENSLQERINDKCPGLNYATMKDNYNKLMKESKLIVTTYNCTTPVEALYMNVPTIIYWRPDHWELSPSAKPLFNKLKDCGVFHDTPGSAADMVDRIWEDVDGWWQTKEVRLACNEFRDWFCRDSEDFIGELARFCKS